MRLTILYNDDNACDYHRIRTPLRYLDSEDGDDLTYVDLNSTIRESYFKSAEIVLFSRLLSFDIEPLKKKFGFKIWLDIDDYWNLYDDHYLYRDWRKNAFSSRIRENIALADVVSTTTSLLAEKIKPFNKNVVVVPNGLAFGHEQFVPDKTESDKIRFMFAGGASHKPDLKSIKGYFELCKNAWMPRKAEFILAGYNPSNSQGEYAKMNHLLKKMPNYSTRNVLPINRYMEHYNYADVSLAPLRENEFNTCKSNLKVVEAGAFSIPIIASDMHPYVVDKENPGVILCKNANDWYNATLDLLDNPTKVLDLGKSLNEYVKEKYDLVKINPIRRQILNSLK